MSTPTLRWLQIHQYEQFEPVRIEFSAKENLILGLNGAGKTQLLKLIWAVLSLNFRDLAGLDLDIEFALDTCLAAAPGSSVRISGRVIIAPEPDKPTSSGRLVASMLLEGKQAFEFELKNGQAALRLDGNTLAVAPETRDGSVAPHMFNWDSQNFDRRFDMFTSALPVDGCCFLGESDREFGAFTDSFEFEVRSAGKRRWLRFDHAELVRADMRSWRDLFHVVNRFVSNLKWDEFQRGFHPAAISIELGLLYAALGLKGVRLIPRPTRTAEERVEYRGVEVHVQFPGAEIADRNLTFGQRRALYAGLVTQTRPQVPVVCDEIDNGMHPRLVLALLEMWSDRQVFVATHNPLVIDSTNFYSPADVREKIHIVRRRDDGRQVVKVFDDETAREIHAAIDVKIQSPSAVLETEGLW